MAGAAPRAVPAAERGRSRLRRRRRGPPHRRGHPRGRISDHRLLRKEGRMKILLASSIDPAAIETLERDHDVVRAFNAPEEQLAGLVCDREAVVFRSGVRISARVIDAGPNLSLLVRAGSGLDNIDIAHARERGVPVVRVPGSSAQPVAELTFALLLSLVRRVALADRTIRAGHWP